MITALSGRAAEILELAAQGLTDKQIAAKLEISAETVHTHWKRLRLRFNASSRTEILAQVNALRDTSEADNLAGQVEFLRFQLAEKDRLQIELEAANALLEEELKVRDAILAKAFSETAKQSTESRHRLELLERLNDLNRKNRVVQHQGEYGASWRKELITESVDLLKGTAEQWLAGDVTFFDIADPEALAEMVLQFPPHAPFQENVILNYSVNVTNGEVRNVLEFIVLEPIGKDGVGKYHALALDITDWVPALKDWALKLT